MSLCPDNEYRNSLTEQEFWEYVLHTEYPNWIDSDDPDLDDDLSQATCTVCGSNGACAYDSEGRPMIHTEDDRND